VAQGLYLDAGGNDVSYSTQRIDEIDLRLADVNRTSAELAAKEAATDIRLAAEEHRFETLSRADLELLASGMVWKLGASNGERIGIGDTLAQVIDCGAAFIVAAIPQRQFSAVEVGSIAQFRLSGETTDRTGRVLSVTGDSSVAIDRNLAATPVADPATTAVVRVEVPPSGNNGAACLVGRTARVLLPRAGDGMLAWLSKWVP
jgi:multidrug resistance efflux pump